MGKYGKYHVDYQRAYRAGMTNLVFALEPKQVTASRLGLMHQGK